MRFDYSSPEPRRRRLPVRRHTAVVIAVAVSLVALAFISRPGVAKKQDAPSAQTESLDLLGQAEDALPDASGVDYDTMLQATVTDDLEIPSPSDWSRITIKPGQSLSAIFDGQGLPATDWIEILKLGSDAERLKKLKAGEELHLRVNAGHLAELKYDIDESHTLNIRRTGNGFEAIVLAAQIEHRPAFSYGEINDSLFLSAQRAGLSGRLIMEMASVFGYDVDFALDIRRGDRFVVVYDRLYKDGKKLRDGDILAAEFVNQDRELRAVRFTDADGNTAYYTPEGDSMRKAFIRTPLDVFRISSHFNPGRFHPVLNRIRSHKGTDYAAPTGTPIKATGEGRVVFAGVKGGYGNCVVLRHGSTYQTLYGHMSKIRSGIRTGASVKQGQIIGYVGSTGLATGPHLHYEFLVNGTHRNPVTVALPRANPVARADLPKFKNVSAPLMAQIETLSSAQFASASDALGAEVAGTH